MKQMNKQNQNPGKRERRTLTIPFFNRKRKKLKKKKEKADLSYRSFPYLKKIKPKEKYVFHSDYFQIDDYYTTILSFFHNDAANDGFEPFWGLFLIPSGLPAGVTTINLEQVSRMSEKWILDHQHNAESVADKNEIEQHRSGSSAARMKASKAANDIAQIDMELNDGASYLNVQNRLMVKAPSLEDLDKAVLQIERLYSDRFGTLWVAPFQGEQRRELGDIFARNEKKKDKGFYYTSREYAGSYSLVTHGLEDPEGEYVGDMVGDVNASAVLFDVDRYSHHVIVASEQHSAADYRIKAADMWGSKISQAALARGHRVVHIILNEADLDLIGPKFECSTVKIDMNKGEINMLEVFGDKKDELALFSIHIQKMINMAEQLCFTSDEDRALIRYNLESLLTDFYIHKGMWQKNAPKFREKLRLAGLRHNQAPLLQDFVLDLDQAYEASLGKGDTELQHAIGVIRGTFTNMLNGSGDLFNRITTQNIDEARRSRRVIYDFSNMRERGEGLAMAQLVNVIGFAVQNLDAGDVLLIHGAEHISVQIQDYMKTQFGRLFNKGGRIALLYDSIDSFLEMKEFNKYDAADYTIISNMTENQCSAYQEKLGEDLPPDMKTLITDKIYPRCYIHRGISNVIFEQNLLLRVPESHRQKKKGGI